MVEQVKMIKAVHINIVLYNPNAQAPPPSDGSRAIPLCQRLLALCVSCLSALVSDGWLELAVAQKPILRD